MAQELITALVTRLANIPQKLHGIVTAYILSLMIEAPKHTQAFAALTSGTTQGQFSRLLSLHKDLAIRSLIQIATACARSAAKSREPLVSGTRWTVAILIDATLHPRSSLHVQNAQRFNHGQGFVIGHQWTNIVLYLAGRVIPLPPIPFSTKAECKRRGMPYKTEHERIEEYLATLNLAAYIGRYQDEEIVVLTDSGYDDKRLERTIITKGWDFVTAIKTSRGAMSVLEATSKKGIWRRIDDLFWAMRKHAPWTTVRIIADGGKKRRSFRARKLIGFIKGVSREIALVCSEKSKGKGKRYFACSNSALTQGAILRAYSIRWRVELFHRATKERLGLLDAGVESFESLTSHVHWVYCAWLLLHEIQIEGATTLLDKQRRLTALAVKAPWAERLRSILAAKNQFGGLKRQEDLLRAGLQEAMAA